MERFMGLVLNSLTLLDQIFPDALGFDYNTCVCVCVLLVCVFSLTITSTDLAERAQEQVCVLAQCSGSSVLAQWTGLAVAWYR